MNLKRRSAALAHVLLVALPLTARADEPESRYLKDIRALTSDEMGITRAGEAYFSADGQRVCFQAYPQGADAYQIYVMNLDGTGLTRVSTGEGATTCAFFHPDGTRLIFGANHHDQRVAGHAHTGATPGGASSTSAASSTPPASAAVSAGSPPSPSGSASTSGSASRGYTWTFYPGMDIFEYTFANQKLRPLISADGYDAECAYSPDGRWIVFSSMRDGDQEIYIASSDGREVRRITRAAGYDGGPFFSPDGKRIVYRSDRHGNGNLQIFVNTLAGDAERQITHDPDVLHWCPYWHPSGKWLIYTRADHGAADAPKRPNYDLYLIRDDGSEQLQITADPQFDGLPSFSNDGRKLLWTSRRGGLKSPHVFVADFLALTKTGERVESAASERAKP